MNGAVILQSLAFIQFNAWKIVGLTGSLIFGIRFVLQWIASERARRQIIPIGFWECSLLGTLLSLSYFVFYRHDSVGILLTCLPAPIYARNLYMKWREILHPPTADDRPKPAEMPADS